MVCFDASRNRLTGDVRGSIPPVLGQPECYNYEDRRSGTADLFVFLDANRPLRHVQITDHRIYSDTVRIGVFLDNLSTPRSSAPSEIFAVRKDAGWLIGDRFAVLVSVGSLREGRESRSAC